MNNLSDHVDTQIVEDLTEVKGKESVPFSFDVSKSYELNIEALKSHLESKDQEMAGILFKYLGNITSEDEISDKIRNRFNEVVLQNLEKILVRESQTKSEAVSNAVLPE